MTNVAMTSTGETPAEVRERHGFKPDTPVKLIETRNGILLVPLTEEPMDESLRQELAEWQQLGVETWDTFPYESES